MGAILYNENKNPDILDKVKMAVQFHFNTSKDQYYFGDWGYHWDFQNYALLETYRLVKNVLSPEEKKEWENGLSKYKENINNPLTNWIAMRAYSSLLRYNMWGQLKNKFFFYYRMLKVDKARQKDGCYDDYRNWSRPIQYHVFTLALLHRIYLISPSRKIKKHFLSGVQYFWRFIDPEGCFNFIGRGHEQIFGYGAALYVLEGAKCLDPNNAEQYQNGIIRIWNYLQKFKRNHHFPLVLNSYDDSAKYGWYDYHHLSVYEAFLGVWLGLAQTLLPKKENVFIQKKPIDCFFHVFNKTTQTVIISNPNYFIVFSGGTPEYLSEPGITPAHIYFRGLGVLFSCPGGPSHRKYGKINQIDHIEKNMIAPLFKDINQTWIVPAFQLNRNMRFLNDTLLLTWDYDHFTLTRSVIFEKNRIKFKDHFKFKDNENILEFRVFNFPVLTDRYNVQLQNDKQIILSLKKQKISVCLSETDFKNKRIEKLEQIKTAKGVVTVFAVRMHDFQSKNEIEKSVCFSIEKMV